MKIKFGLLIVLALLPASALCRDGLQKTDVRAFDLWTKAVREDYALYRSLEDDLLLNPRTFGAKDERGILARNLHQDLMIDPPVSTRLIEAGKPFNEVDNCRIAIRRFRAVATTAQRVSSIKEAAYRSDAKDYLRAADQCEKGLKFPPFSSRFRDVVRAF